MALTYLKNVVTLSLETEKCVGCEKCAEVCPHGVLLVTNNTARVTKKDLCMECGACAQNCPANAIKVNPGVGCASAILTGWLRGSEPSCACSNDNCC